MKLKQILDHLTFNELSQHRIGGYELGHIADADIAKILSVINSGIEIINQRTNLLNGLVTVELSAAIDTYVMDYTYAVVAGNGSSNTKYIKDTVDAPFPIKFRKFLQISDSVGEGMLINSRGVAEALAIPAYNKFQHPTPKDGDIVYVEYEYDPVDLVATTYAAASLLEYPLPYFTAPALYAYVSGTFNEGVDTNTVEGVKANSMSKFEYELTQLKNNNVLVGDTYYSSKFINNGWI